MALPALVLTHGGEHGADCWDLTVDELAAEEPALRVLAVDLPGRPGTPGDLSALDSAAADPVLRDIEYVGLDAVLSPDTP
jgi:pimeloyl-ACP methyl ester carboxylesterase